MFSASNLFLKMREESRPKTFLVLFWYSFPFYKSGAGQSTECTGLLLGWCEQARHFYNRHGASTGPADQLRTAHPGPPTWTGCTRGRPAGLREGWRNLGPSVCSGGREGVCETMNLSGTRVSGGGGDAHLESRKPQSKPAGKAPGSAVSQTLARPQGCLLTLHLHGRWQPLSLRPVAKISGNLHDGLSSGHNRWMVIT